MAWTFHFRPRIVDALRDYSTARLAQDVGAGVTVGVVALPLAMAFAIASGLTPQAGLWSAIIGGLLVSLLGGSSVQIAGPAGAFIVIVYGIVERHGVANLLIATACAGVLLFVMGLLRLGTLVRHVPVSVIIGFTNGIAVLIALSQLRDWLGLQIDKLPADFFSQIATLWAHAGGFNLQAFALGTACMLGLYLWPRLWSRTVWPSAAADLPGFNRAAQVGARIPGPVVALVTLSAVAHGFALDVPTIGSRFGSIPQGLPVWAVPSFNWESVKQLVSPTLTIALLGAIESLLCARVADQISPHPRHDPNQELMAQGVANAVVPFVGGLPVTGTIARTVTNVRAGATSPIAGIAHALALLMVVLLAAPLAMHVPLSVLAGILLFVAWNMGEWREFARLRHFSSHYRVLMLGTFVLTVVFDLTVAIEFGIAMACLLFVLRMGSLFSIEPQQRPRAAPGTPARAQHYTLSGALFFASVSRIDALSESLAAQPAADLAGCTVVLDARQLVALDTTGAEALRDLSRLLGERGAALRIEHALPQPASLLQRCGLGSLLGAPD